MTRRGTVALAAALLGLTGCLHDGAFSVEQVLGWEDGRPQAPKVAPASLETAERVERLGRQILVQNTFPGIDPLFHTVGVKEPILFHRGPGELFISDGLADRCKTDAELAAVLCSELGKMKAEQQSAARVGRDTSTIQEVGADGTPVEKKPAAAQPGLRPADPTTYARELLTGAGFNPAELERVEPLLALAAKNDGLRKQMTGSAAAPEWRK
ncbi:MAG: hypothetical protein K2P78_01890 [Gemmataceae bacterium]|nr:hypothetical protein [Gemmataceae bacterium]